MNRVLFIASQPFFQWRGSPIRVGFDVQALAELGYEVDFLTLPFGEDREIPGVNVIRAKNMFRVTEFPIGPSVIKARFDLVLLGMAKRMVREKSYDVIHGIEDAGALGALLKKRAGSRLVYEKHSDPSSYKKGLARNMIMALYAQVERFTARRADAVIGTGPGLVEQLRGMVRGASVHHIFDIPSSLVEASPERVAVLAREYRDAPDEIVALFVGSFAVYQGVDLLFDAIPEVCKFHAKIRFVIIGGTPEQIQARRDELAARGCADSVRFLGKIPPDELPNYLAAADILLSPRLAGVNTPLKLLDYMKAGRAIVATDTQANRLLLDETTGVLTGVSPAALADGVRRLADNRETREALGAAGRKWIDEKYNFSEFKRRLSLCYEGIQGGAA